MNEERNYIIWVMCHLCGKEFELKVRIEDYFLFEQPNRPNIQDIFPYLTPAERELLISNTCQECWIRCSASLKRRKKTMNDPKKQAQEVADMLNSLSFNYEGFCQEMTKEHRTLQQSFTRLCIFWLSTCASDDYKYDGRNEASHEIAKALIESQDPDFIGHIPLI